MPACSGCLVREAQPGVDDEAVAALMVEYLTWAIDRLGSDYGVDEPPTHPSLVRDSLVNYGPPIGKLLLAECDGQPGRCRRATHARGRHGGREAHVCRASLAKSTSGLRNP